MNELIENLKDDAASLEIICNNKEIENQKLRADLEFAVSKLEAIIKVSGTSCRHYHYASEALARIQGVKGE